MEDSERPTLTAPEARVLGCLLEKQRTTPELYPLTLNALVNACNQTSNRFPVVRYDDATVMEAVDGLRGKQLLRVVHSPSNRAVKYRQVVDEALALGPDEAALLGVLLLRGPQTIGELRTRAERMHPFPSLEEVESTLQRLDARHGIVRRLERQPGQKEARFAQLLSPHGDVEPAAGSSSAPPREDRLGQLEARVAELEAQVAELRALLE